MAQRLKSVFSIDSIKVVEISDTKLNYQQYRWSIIKTRWDRTIYFNMVNIMVISKL